MSNAPKNRSAPIRGTTFVNYSPAEAQGTKKDKGTARWLATDIPVQHLVKTPTQATKISHIYASGQLEDHTFKASDAEDQRVASALLARYGLDTASLNDLKARWSRRWSWSSKGSRSLSLVANVGMQKERQERRKDMFPYHLPSVLGMSRLQESFPPAISSVLEDILPTTKDVALRDSYASLLSRFNLSFGSLHSGSSETEAPGQAVDWAHSRYRWLLNPKDSKSLYRQHHRKEGVQVRTRPHQNVDAWLDPKSPDYNETLASAIFHYKARTEKHERFEACIATEEMKSAAWTYGHGSQLILDGTFGISRIPSILCTVRESFHGLRI